MWKEILPFKKNRKINNEKQKQYGTKQNNQTRYDKMDGVEIKKYPEFIVIEEYKVNQKTAALLLIKLPR